MDQLDEKIANEWRQLETLTAGTSANRLARGACFLRLRDLYSQKAREKSADVRRAGTPKSTSCNGSQSAPLDILFGVTENRYTSRRSR
jgi:hypothetical protein